MLKNRNTHPAYISRAGTFAAGSPASIEYEPEVVLYLDAAEVIRKPYAPGRFDSTV